VNLRQLVEISTEVKQYAELSVSAALSFSLAIYLNVDVSFGYACLHSDVQNEKCDVSRRNMPVQLVRAFFVQCTVSYHA
jgi:hypothetical protein